MNFLALSGSGYENNARGILYVIYEMLWKLMSSILTLIDEVTNLFYSFAGIKVENGSVENKNIFDQLVNQNVIGVWYAVFIAIAGGLVIIFSLVAIIRTMANAEDGEKRSLAPILRNIGLALLLLVALGPIMLVLISILGNIAVAISSLGTNKVSLSDLLFANGSNIITVFNETHSTEYTSYRQLGNDFLYDLVYNPSTAEGATQLHFYWYIIVLGGIFILYNLIRIVFDMFKRVVNVVALYVASPFAISKMVLDNGDMFKKWETKFFKEFILLFAQIGSFLIFAALVNVLNSIDFANLAKPASSASSVPEGLVPDESATVVAEPETFSLLNGIGRTIVVMAAIAVTRSTTTMLGDLVGGEKEDKTSNLLKTLIYRVSNKTPTRTKTITKNTTTTKRETVYTEQVSAGLRGLNVASASGATGIDNTTNKHTTNITQNINTNNKFESRITQNISNRQTGGSTPSYGAEKVSPGSIYMAASKPAIPASEIIPTAEITKNASKAIKDAAKGFDAASGGLGDTISRNDNKGLSDALNKYSAAYSKESALLKKNYRDFEVRTANTLKGEMSNQARQELKNISNSYRKAQMDYNKTADKLNQYKSERMSTAQALKVKETADKQRETLMNAANRANQFYNNQKKGE